MLLTNAIYKHGCIMKVLVVIWEYEMDGRQDRMKQLEPESIARDRRALRYRSPRKETAGYITDHANPR